DRVGVRVLVEVGDHPYRLVEQLHQVREGVAEEAGDPHGDVNSWTAQLLDGLQLEPGDAPGLGVPHRTDTEQRQDLGHVVAAGARVGGAPHHDADGGRVATLVGEVAAQQVVGQALPGLPGQLARHTARVDRGEVLAGRQHVQPAAGR